MTSSRFVKSGVFLAFAVLSTTAYAEDVTTHLFGWANINYSLGNRQGDANGNDSLGVGPFALGVKAREDNITFTGLIGGSALSTDSSSSTSSNMAIRDAYITIENISESHVSVSLGPQAALFGLKSNGFAGDSSLQPSVEFGGGQGTRASTSAPFAVAQQAGPTLKAWYDFSGKAKLIAAAFDTNESQTNQPVEGSQTSKNFYVALRTDDLGVNGLYSFLGSESRYVASARASRPIHTVGLGFKQNLFDVSAEWFYLHKDLFAATPITDDETYTVIEATLYPLEKMGVYADYANANRLSVTTWRAGMTYQISKLLKAQAEWSFDKTPNDASNVSGVDLRLQASF